MIQHETGNGNDKNCLLTHDSLVGFLQGFSHQLCWICQDFEATNLITLGFCDLSNQGNSQEKKKTKQSTFIGHWKLELTSASTNPSHAKKTNKTTIKIPEIIHIYVYHGRAKGQIWISVTKQWFCGPLGQLVALPDSGFSVAQQRNQLRYFPGRQGRMGTPFF